MFIKKSLKYKMPTLDAMQDPMKYIKTTTLSAMIIIIITTLLLVFALSLNETIRGIVFDYLSVGNELRGKIIYTIIIFIILLFAVVMITLYNPDIINRVILRKTVT